MLIKCKTLCLAGAVGLLSLPAMAAEEVKIGLPSWTGAQAIGHLLGASGAIEAAFTALAIRDGVCPPTLNLENPSFDSPIDLTAKVAKKREINAAISNSFGFGGTNAALVLKKVD